MRKFGFRFPVKRTVFAEVRSTTTENSMNSNGVVLVSSPVYVTTFKQILCLSGESSHVSGRTGGCFNFQRHTRIFGGIIFHEKHLKHLYLA
jgi:7-cyano-7-deazaguanine synthase in queuosine biosynthesis